eukprot:TRINITY_DN4060_c0_g1_i1.p1 TRINITY_DN4060_c0_g1~~TRINITY_DN4060_c0_g1_i1.p1  ORF type:complete len:132 (+),score=31.80 TRINITY_DN4060_c0_g1_i1:433-828(+)
MDTNLTLVNDDFTYEDAIDADTFKAGSAYSIFVMGINGDAEYELDVITAVDIQSSPIQELDYPDSDDDDGDDDGGNGLSGGAIAGIVIGVLVGVGLIVVFGIYVRRKARSIPSQADYEAVPTNHFLSLIHI